MKKSLIKRIGLACPALSKTNGSSAVSIYYSVYIWCVSLSICARHGPLLPMHDNYPAPECADNKKQKGFHWVTPCQHCCTNFNFQVLCAIIIIVSEMWCLYGRGILVVWDTYSSYSTLLNNISLQQYKQLHWKNPSIINNGLCPIIFHTVPNIDLCLRSEAFVSFQKGPRS